MMKRVRALTPLVAFVFGCAHLPTAFASDPLAALQKRIIDISEQVTPSVVFVEAALKNNKSRKLVTGSGFLIDADGIVVTNEHVVEKAQKVSVIVPGRDGRYTAEVVGTDKQTDIAVLRIDRRKDEDPFATVPLGDSDKLKVGEWVIAIGNPYGLDGTVSLGIVSGKGRDLKAEQLLNDFIQTDAMIDHGSSGGPLIDLRGNVVGVNSRGQGRGIGFTIPINTARRVVDDLVAAGRIARGYLGVGIQPLDRELATYWGIDSVHGVVVGSVTPGSPAQAAGLDVGDIITRFDGEEIRAEKGEDLGQFQRLVAGLPVGKNVEVEVFRDGARERVGAVLGVQPKVVPDEEETDFGFSVQEITESIYRVMRLDQRTGVVISFVERGSEAAEAGMARGDQLFEIEGRAIDDIETFREAMKDVDTTRPFLVRALRGADTRFMLIVPRKADISA